MKSKNSIMQNPQISKIKWLKNFNTFSIFLKLNNFEI